MLLYADKTRNIERIETIGILIAAANAKINTLDHLRLGMLVAASALVFGAWTVQIPIEFSQPEIIIIVRGGIACFFSASLFQPNIRFNRYGKLWQIALLQYNKALIDSYNKPDSDVEIFWDHEKTTPAMNWKAYELVYVVLFLSSLIVSILFGFMPILSNTN